MVTHDEIQEIIARLTGKMNKDLTANLFGGYANHMAKKITLPNAGSGIRNSPAMRLEWEKDEAIRSISCVNENGETQQIKVRFIDEKEK